MAASTQKWTLAFLCFAMGAHAAPTRFDMRDGGLRNLVQFISDAQLEKIVGVSNQIDGWLELDPEKLADGVKGEFTVDVRTFETGLAARNEQLREKFLNAAEHPVATFTVNKLVSSSKPRLVEGQYTVLRLEGTLALRGAKKSQVVAAKVAYFKESPTTRQRLPGNLLKLSGTLDLDTQTYQMPIPEPFQTRVTRFIQITVDVVGSDRIPQTAGAPAPSAR